MHTIRTHTFCIQLLNVTNNVKLIMNHRLKTPVLYTSRSSNRQFGDREVKVFLLSR